MVIARACARPEHDQHAVRIDPALRSRALD
jgi:hypothetical protein